jgi:hypothetical protein
VEAVPASASAATTTTICSANIYTEHPEGVPRGVFFLCERIQVQHENKDHYRSNSKSRWERWDARRRRSKFNTRTKTIIEAIARVDGRDGTQGGEGRERQGDSLPKKVSSSGYLACSLVSLYQ